MKKKVNRHRSTRKGKYIVTHYIINDILGITAVISPTLSPLQVGTTSTSPLSITRPRNNSMRRSRKLMATQTHSTIKRSALISSHKPLSITTIAALSII
jgi:hypothetical protein